MNYAFRVRRQCFFLTAKTKNIPHLMECFWSVTEQLSNKLGNVWVSFKKKYTSPRAKNWLKSKISETAKKDDVERVNLKSNRVYPVSCSDDSSQSFHIFLLYCSKVFRSVYLCAHTLFNGKIRRKIEFLIESLVKPIFFKISMAFWCPQEHLSRE
jgi:hypothetical protein